MKSFEIILAPARELTHRIKVNNQYLQDTQCIELINSALKDLTNNSISITPKEVKNLQELIQKEIITYYCLETTKDYNVYIGTGTINTAISIYKNTEKYTLKEI